MARVLSISSQVVYGHVGNSVGGFVLQRMGHEVLGLPTVLLSNRPGYSAISGMRIAPETLEGMLAALEANGWLSLDAIFSGYLPSASHVELCACWVKRLKTARPETVYFCDPILGDEPTGLYIDEAASRAIREELVPLADILTPNRFELGWLSGHAVATPHEAISAARSLKRPLVIVTSAPAESADRLCNICVQGEEAELVSVRRRDTKAFGAGDFFASLFLAHFLNGEGGREALIKATKAADAVLEASEGQAELTIVPTQSIWGR